MQIALRLWLFILSCCVVLASVAYEIGDMNVLSSANEPLEGRIPLVGNPKDKSSPVIIDIASKIDYMRHKVRRNYYVSDLKVAIEHDLSGEPYIRVQSSEPMMARTIEFLVMMLTAEDQSFAKYRFVLPQIRDESRSPIIAQNRLLSAQKRRLLAGKSLPSSLEKGERVTKENTKVYKVLAGDSLSKIAMKLVKHYPQFKSWRPLMKQLIQLNPDAFYKSNINRLRVSTALKLPVPAHWNSRSLIAASSDNGYKKKSSLVNNYQKIKKASWQDNSVEGKTIKKAVMHSKNTEEKAHKVVLNLSKSRTLSPLIASKLFHRSDQLSYRTLSAMKVQGKNSDNYQTQGVFSGTIM